MIEAIVTVDAYLLATYPFAVLGFYLWHRIIDG